MSDYQSELTAIYNKLVDIQGSLSKLALLSRINTMQGLLQAQVDSLNSRMAVCEENLNQMNLTMSDILTEMRTLS